MIMKVIIVLGLLLVCDHLASAEPAYRSRGWRPNGQGFNPVSNQQQLPQRYGPPPDTPVTTTTATTTSTTTPSSREPTTPTPNEQTDEGSSSAEEDFETNPALAIANSFAFNRPIYVYNGFPVPTYAILQ